MSAFALVLMESWFQIHDNLTRLVPQFGIWEIHTEDGTDFFTVPAEENFYQRCTDVALRDILSLSEAQVISAEINQAPIPECIREYVDGSGLLRKAVLVACDGSFCPITQSWATGLVFLQSGQCLAKGGQFKTGETFHIGPNFNRVHVRSSSIELLALHSGLQTSTEVGIVWRSDFSAAQQDEWDSFAAHLILVVDTMKPIESLLHLGDGGYFDKDLFDPLRGALWTDIDDCICHSIAAEISRAIAVFQRVTIMHRENLPRLYHEGSGMACWQGPHWLPHRLADRARLVRKDIVCFPDVEERHADFKVRNVSRSRNMSDRSNELQSVTFSFPW